MNGTIACQGCDLLVDVAGLEQGETASCPRCGSVLTRLREDIYNRVLACASAGLILLLLANAYPFLAFSSSGLQNMITLAETPATLWQNDLHAMGVVVAAFIIIIPAVVLGLLIALCLPLAAGRAAPWLVQAARGIFLARNWAMVEVFIIGVIVSLVKIAHMATVSLGISFWAYCAFTVCFIFAITALDRYQCWEDIEAVQRS